MSAATATTLANLRGRLTSTVGRELMVGVTGLALVAFILVHLAGNLLVFAGAESINHYSETLHGMGALLWAARLGLIAAFVVHIAAAISLARAATKARAVAYEAQVYSGPKTRATRMMLYSGLFILFFLLYHLYDFTLRAPVAPRSVVNGVDLELFGVVWNSFANPIRVFFYVAAMVFLGLHLTHAISSVQVTLGVLRDKSTPGADRLAKGFGIAMAVGFSSVPLYVFCKAMLFGGQP